MNKLNKLTSIKNWAEEDRPREKFLLKGKMTLSDSELIAILVGSGSANESAVELSKRIMLSVENNINKLAKLTVNDLQKFKGIGIAKAITIAAALELGRRRKDSSVIDKPQIKTSKAAYELIKEKLIDLPHEEFWVLFLNKNNRTIKEELISRGGIDATLVDIKIIIKSAIECLASSIILFHNHPSGNPKPSEADITLTKKIVSACNFFSITVLDHLICFENNYTSLMDEGLM